MNAWTLTHKGDPDCAALADRHYSRRKIGSPQFMPPGQTIVLRAPGAVWGWWRPHPRSGLRAMNGLDGWTCTIFRNESRTLSSLLILEAEEFITDCGPDGLITYVADGKIRSSNPGCCFKFAGYRATGRSADGRKTLLQKPWRDRSPKTEQKGPAAGGSIEIPAVMDCAHTPEEERRQLGGSL